jgi:hypothetical protein
VQLLAFPTQEAQGKLHGGQRNALRKNPVIQDVQ